MVQNKETRIVKVTIETASAAATVLAEAFMNYPVIRYFFADQGEWYRKRVFELYNLSVKGGVAQHWPVMGIEYHGNLVAAACLKGLVDIPETDQIREEERRFFSQIGPQAASRIKGYDDVQEKHRYPQPHYYLQDIGVLEAFRGMGFAGLLLKQIDLISKNDPLSKGIGLDTQVPANVDIYLHFGYKVIAATTLDGIPFWSMFKQNQL